MIQKYKYPQLVVLTHTLLSNNKERAHDRWQRDKPGY